jgi:hypothetical protein
MILQTQSSGPALAMDGEPSRDWHHAFSSQSGADCHTRPVLGANPLAFAGDKDHSHRNRPRLTRQGHLLKSPFGVAIDAQNRVWVSNAQSDTVIRFPANDPSKTESFRVGLVARGIAVDSKGNLWAASNLTPGFSPARSNLDQRRCGQGPGISRVESDEKR